MTPIKFLNEEQLSQLFGAGKPRWNISTIDEDLTNEWKRLGLKEG